MCIVQYDSMYGRSQTTNLVTDLLGDEDMNQWRSRNNITNLRVFADSMARLLFLVDELHLQIVEFVLQRGSLTVTRRLVQGC